MTTLKDWTRLGYSENSVTKVSVNLPTELVEEIKALAAQRNTTVTEVFRSALSTEKYLSEHVRKGAKILLKEPNNKVKQLVFSHQLK